MVLTIISSDEVKKRLKGYDPLKAELFHRESSRIADQEFSRQLKESSGAGRFM